MSPSDSQPKVIIGVHGLANKPPRETLAEWWRLALAEGLRNVGVAEPEFELRLVYWADLLYSHPKHAREHWEFDPLYNREPYREADEGALKEYADSWRDDIRAGARGLVGETVDLLKRDLGMDSFADSALRHLLKDLAFYYDEERKIENRVAKLELTRRVLREDVAKAIREEHAAGKKIMVIGHSMGSITSYDAMRAIGREPDNEVEVACYATIGSPLGLPHVKFKIIDEWTRRPDYEGGDPQLRTPTIVSERWKNFADRKDPVAADIHLADDFQPNRAGVAVEDDLVLNDYYTVQTGERKPNHHKSYGYLRTPEVATYVRHFLGA